MVCRAKFRWNHSGIFGAGALIFCVWSSAEDTSRGLVEMGRVGGGVEPATEAAATTGAGGSVGVAAGAGSGAAAAGGGAAEAFAIVFSASLGGAGRAASGLRAELAAADFELEATTFADLGLSF